ncbi:uncharacterized protein LOC100836775 isoform X2 [Brachypodium distachyon]|uniref:uncharacterized protein LOC100836775 isoform X2 n=1 Tax=Brachypodium distachyon TaxID=15368 RepID=UPI00071D4C5E|nr:uncharacterized protein LOC100836775 isoform X2 [Brachypodium distachyon]|eukprot:XP_014755803.1 uncharacterized protein LOC100836775 isoform X2 [Brachypodium distachyon]
MASRAAPVAVLFVFSVLASLLAAGASAAAAAGADSAFVLAAARTQRKDPLDGLRYYAGGWNISSEHYWASVGFSAAPVFAAAGVWFALFGAALFLAGCCFCCFPSRSASYSRAVISISLLLLLVFTAAAAVGCGVLYDGQGRFHGSTAATVDYVVARADETAGNLRDFSGFLKAAKAAGIGPVSLPDDVKGTIDDVVRKVSAASDELADRTASNSARIRAALDTMYVTSENKEDPDRACGRDANPCLCWPRVLGVWTGVANLPVGVPRLDHGHGNAGARRHFPPPAQRGGRHVRGDGRVGAAAPAGAHGAGRHPAVRGHGGGGGSPEPEQGGELPPRGRAQRRHRQRLQRRQPAPTGRAALLQPVRPTRPAPLQPLHPRPPSPGLLPRRAPPDQPGRPGPGLAGPRLPDRPGHPRCLRDARAADAGDVHADGGRGERELRDREVRAGHGGRGGLRVRAASV